ncbi:hypothetical protein SSPO_000890 [Streptomyces antimycoticus]|uniref:Uncharacterized protein n=1 Tax=Streptomyces antimycoticus TaxID=68175 RepID=A0A499UJH2_9ACTN|nr:hypothetical protein SSPO_000890 [Streptomyces antimycoticus]
MQLPSVWGAPADGFPIKDVLLDNENFGGMTAQYSGREQACIASTQNNGTFHGPPIFYFAA